MTGHEHGHPAGRRRARRHLIRGLGLLAAVAGISSLHFVTDPSRIVLHEVYNYLCYVPIIFGAYWYGAWGGVAAAAVTSAAFIPHIRAAWTGNDAYSASLYAQVVVFHALGLTVGLLVADHVTGIQLTTTHSSCKIQIYESTSLQSTDHRQIGREPPSRHPQKAA
jgi:glucose-6-phosphate-specific signal transduction histidine kinase